MPPSSTPACWLLVTDSSSLSLSLAAAPSIENDGVAAAEFDIDLAFFESSRLRESASFLKKSFSSCSERKARIVFGVAPAAYSNGDSGVPIGNSRFAFEIPIAAPTANKKTAKKRIGFFIDNLAVFRIYPRALWL